MMLGVLIPLIPGIGVLIFGNVRAAEAMFRDLDHAVGHVVSFRIMAAGWAVFILLTLAGFLLFALELWDEGQHRLLVLAAAAVLIHTIFVTFEIVSNQQKWDTLGAERSGAGWRSGELPEGPVVASSPFGGLSLHLLPAL